jgi:DNA-binding Lrp family transcriptional regulator
MADWAFITNHGLVLTAIAKHPNMTARQIGDEVGITEKTVHKIILDLGEGGYVSKVKAGRQNTYQIHPDVPIKDGISDASVGELLVMLGWKRKRRWARAGSQSND